MTTQSGLVWTQPALFPPPAIEMRLRYGFVLAENHLQAQCEAYNPSDGELLAMKAWPHAPISALQQRAVETLEWLYRTADGLVVPFP